MNNHIIWVTGASSGIGAALAIGYSYRGAKLILSSRDLTKLEEVKAQCSNPSDVRLLPLDLEDLGSLPSKADEAWSVHGHIDMLINSGGVSQRGLGMHTKLEIEQKIMTINFWGTTVLSKSVIEKMSSRSSGHIVCVSSLVGKFGTKYRSAYAASKHALHGYFDSLRIEVYEKNIDISIICPGFIKTNVSINALTESGNSQGTMDDAQNKGMPVKRFAEVAIGKLDQKQEEIYIGGKEIYGVYLKRFVPKLFSKYIRKAKVV